MPSDFRYSFWPSNALSISKGEDAVDTYWKSFLSAVFLGLYGCAQVPPQSVELSATLGRDLQEVQRSHRKAVDLLLDRDVERVNDYIERVVIPVYITNVIEKTGPHIQETLIKATSSNATADDKKLAYIEMQKIVQGITGRVEKQRRGLLNEIDGERKTRLQELDLAYAQMQQANSVLTAHLASVVKVHSVQDELLAKAGLKNFREKVGEAALDADRNVEKALGTETEIANALENLKKLFSKPNSPN